ncbi:MAG: 2-oxo acid dehydrogenase subunit E2, partial [Chloroflexota bacterium]
MAKPILLPKQGNTVESCIILRWYKSIGDEISVGDLLCEVETDKATFEIESPERGVLIGRFFEEGDLVPVMTTIAAVGEAGEDGSALAPSSQNNAVFEATPTTASTPTHPPELNAKSDIDKIHPSISPRARRLANEKNIDWSDAEGSGPNSRIIERDIQALLIKEPKITPVARRMLDSGHFRSPPDIGERVGQIRSRDLIPRESFNQEAALPEPVNQLTPVQDLRPSPAMVTPEPSGYLPIATLHESADARNLQAFSKRLKSSGPALGLSQITQGDLVLLAVIRTLKAFPMLNTQIGPNGANPAEAIHLGVSLFLEQDTIIPVIHNSQALSLKGLSLKIQELTVSAQVGILNPNQLQGGTFTVSNFGALGVSNGTPALSFPQVASLGVGKISLYPT